MGFGCNAAGIIGCRIIDSPRERLIAMITNNFVPCNGRFPQPYKGKQYHVFGNKNKQSRLILTKSVKRKMQNKRCGSTGTTSEAAAFLYGKSSN